MEDLLLDVRVAVRSLGRSRVFTGAVVMTLGLGVAATTVVHSASDHILFGGEDPVGHTVTVGVMARSTTWRVVGVVGDVRGNRFDGEPLPELFVPFSQSGNGSPTSWSGALAALPSAVGLCGPLSLAAARRTREMGIRVSFGGERHHIVWLVLRDGLVVAGAGVALGALGAGALSRFVAASLHGVPPTDRWTH